MIHFNLSICIFLDFKKIIFFSLIQILNNLSSVPLLGENGQVVEGVSHSYTYVASRFSRFGMHTEDLDFFSANYIYHGTSKIWYVIAEVDREDVKNLIRGRVYLF